MIHYLIENRIKFITCQRQTKLANSEFKNEKRKAWIKIQTLKITI